MPILLDTHIFLHMLGAPERISAPQLSLLEDSQSDLFFSLASIWEITIKHTLGKLKLPAVPAAIFPAQLQHYGIELIPITLPHILQVCHLPHHHHDPFDRLIIAQAQLLNMPIMSSDHHFPSYNVQVIR